MGSGKGEWGHEEGVYGLAGELDQGLGFVQGPTIRLCLGQSFLLVQGVQLLVVNRWVVLWV